MSELTESDETDSEAEDTPWEKKDQSDKKFN